MSRYPYQRYDLIGKSCRRMITETSSREYHIAVIGSGGVGKSCLTGPLHQEANEAAFLIEPSSTIRPGRIH